MAGSDPQDRSDQDPRDFPDPDPRECPDSEEDNSVLDPDPNRVSSILKVRCLQIF